MLQRHVLPTILLSAMLLVAGGARAQATASHTVNVRIPSVLRLRLSDAAASDQGRVGLQVTVQHGRAGVAPGRSTVSILANTTWVLKVALESERPDLALSYAVDGSTAQPLSGLASPVAAGGPTAGWQEFEVAYDARSNGAQDGSYDLTVVYTLAQP